MEIEKIVEKEILVEKSFLLVCTGPNGFIVYHIHCNIWFLAFFSHYGTKEWKRGSSSISGVSQEASKTMKSFTILLNRFSHDAPLVRSCANPFLCSFYPVHVSHMKFYCFFSIFHASKKSLSICLPDCRLTCTHVSNTHWFRTAWLTSHQNHIFSQAWGRLSEWTSERSEAREPTNNWA